MFHTFTPRQWLFIIICYLQFCPTWPRGFTSSARTRVTASAQFLALTQSTIPNSLPYTQMLLGLYDTWTLIPYPHWGVGGRHHKPKERLHWWPKTNSCFHIYILYGKTLKQIGDLPDSPCQYWRATKKSRHETF